MGRRTGNRGLREGVYVYVVLTAVIAGLLLLASVGSSFLAAASDDDDDSDDDTVVVDLKDNEELCNVPGLGPCDAEGLERLSEFEFDNGQQLVVNQGDIIVFQNDEDNFHPHTVSAFAATAAAFGAPAPIPGAHIPAIDPALLLGLAAPIAGFFDSFFDPTLTSELFLPPGFFVIAPG